jgi:EAL domain-containing protein (putative c-di-GMP-specific phosphodiesterase class I)
LGLKVVAEGVETEAQFAFLKQHQCDYSQGYFTGRPMPVKDFEALLRKTNNLSSDGIVAGK